VEKNGQKKAALSKGAANELILCPRKNVIVIQANQQVKLSDDCVNQLPSHTLLASDIQ
jgi:hypothetical protein